MCVLVGCVVRLRRLVLETVHASDILAGNEQGVMGSKVAGLLLHGLIRSVAVD